MTTEWLGDVSTVAFDFGDALTVGRLRDAADQRPVALSAAVVLRLVYGAGYRLALSARHFATPLLRVDKVAAWVKVTRCARRNRWSSCAGELDRAHGAHWSCNPRGVLRNEQGESGSTRSRMRIAK